MRWCRRDLVRDFELRARRMGFVRRGGSRGVRRVVGTRGQRQGDQEQRSSRILTKRVVGLLRDVAEASGRVPQEHARRRSRVCRPRSVARGCAARSGVCRRERGGFKMASGEASQGSATGARSFSFDQVSVNSIDRIEVNYTTAPTRTRMRPPADQLKTKARLRAEGGESAGRPTSWPRRRFALRPELGRRTSRTTAEPGAFSILHVFSTSARRRAQPQRANPYALQWRLNYTYNARPTAAIRARACSRALDAATAEFSERFRRRSRSTSSHADARALADAMYNWYDTVSMAAPPISRRAAERR